MHLNIAVGMAQTLLLFLRKVQGGFNSLALMFSKGGVERDIAGKPVLDVCSFVYRMTQCE